MTAWKKILPTALIGLSIAIANFVPVHSQEETPAVATQEETTGSRKVIYISSGDFPPNAVTQIPTPAAAQTRFWQLMDKEVQNTQTLALTESLEQADYRVDLRCAGILNCSQLAVDVKDTDRNVLASFKLKNYSPLWGLAAPNLEKVAHDLTNRLDERIRMLGKGGYGYSE